MSNPTIYSWASDDDYYDGHEDVHWVIVTSDPLDGWACISQDLMGKKKYRVERCYGVRSFFDNSYEFVGLSSTLDGAIQLGVNTFN